MMKIGIVGCGKMAEQHIVQILKINDASIVAVCDTEMLMAKQMAERYGISCYFSDLQAMLDAVKLDVVHITTPPQSHFALGKICLAAGCHVYMEKPFTVTFREAGALIKQADKKNLKIIAGHNAQFTPAMVQMRELVQQGYLGGKPVHMECYYCYELADERYAKAFLGDKEHWLRKLPGTLLQNIISHGISKIVEFLSSDNPMVIAHGFTSSFLKNVGEKNITDELRVLIKDKDGTTAHFTFSTQIGPAPHTFRLHGPKRSLYVDDDHQILIKNDGVVPKSYLNYFLPPFGYAKQYLRTASSNIYKFIKRDFYLPNDAGLKMLIETFYGSIREDRPLPVSYREILLTYKIMDSIFSQIKKS